MDAQPWDELLILADPVRRGLYEYVCRQGHPVTREEAAEARDISRGLAAFHLDKLAEAGLLGTRYETPADQPRGRGRTPKVYESADAEFCLTIPPRNYELIGEILARAVAFDPANAHEAAVQHAHEAGKRYGERFPTLQAALTGLGFEPAAAPTGTILRNCPFHTLAATHPELICALNHAFVEGLGEATHDHRPAHLVPRPDACCVEIRS